MTTLEGLRREIAHRREVERELLRKVRGIAVEECHQKIAEMKQT